MPEAPHRFCGVGRCGCPANPDGCQDIGCIIICKTDDAYPERMEEKDWVTVDVITCAAPNLRHWPGNIHNPEYGEASVLSPEELYQLHVKRAKHILQTAAANGVDALVLGAFGCGAFANDPDAVAKAYADVIREYRQYFRMIEFAVFCMPHETENYDAFRSNLRP